ncbi:MAG: response regulator transcription factor, partial [Bdellovibrionota bacterium]
MKVTVLEDDSRLRSFLKTSFVRNDWDITFCSAIDELETSLMTPPSPDVLILDRMIAGADSLHSLPSWKKQSPHTRVIFLSALDSTDEKVKALNAGADDYLAKPFSVSELEARVEALGRRQASATQESVIIQLGELKIDRLSHHASIGKMR